MNIREMLQVLDGWYAKGRLDEAEKLLRTELELALASGACAAQLTIYNELEGLYRTTKRADEAAAVSEKALALISRMGLVDTIHHGTTLLNGATANRAAGNLEQALSMYQEAARIFEKLGQTESYQMASLYQNISHVYQETGDHKAALTYQERALRLISGMGHNESELATTRVSMAISRMALGEYETAETLLGQALSYYEGPQGKTDGHYGSALAAAGELCWHQGKKAEAEQFLEQALRVVQERYGENDACRTIRNNLERIRG